MKKTGLVLVLLYASILLTSNYAQAALVNASTLNFTPTATSGPSSTLPADGSGSWFAVELLPGDFTVVPLSSLNGLVLGTTQTATSIPTVGNIDDPWIFFGNPGVHQTISNANVLSASGDTATVDFSGWGLHWNGIPIDLSTGSWAGNANGIAEISCDLGSGCGDGAGYTLDYTATNRTEPSGYSDTRYVLHLEGTISAVPVPAAVWLFGSGLLGLIGVARRQQQS